MKKISRDAIQRMVGGISSSSSVIGGGGGGGGGVSQYWVDDNYVSKEFFNRLFEIHDENGEPILPNDVETEIDNIQAMFGFWTNAYLSALGNNPGGGGAELTLASLADVAVQGVTDGQALVWNAAQGKWVPGQGGGGLDPTAMWAELATTGTQQISKTHLTTALSDFVTIDTAQTISGAKTFTKTVYLSAITEPSAGNGLLVYKPASGWSGINSTQWGVGSADSQGVIRSSNTNLLHYKGGTSYTIWDASNDGAGSGLDADLLDGHHAADFALASAITDMATQTWVSTNYLTKTDANNTYLSIAFFRALFRAYTSGGSEVVPNGGSTSTIDNIKAMFGFWTNSYLSALGSNPGGASLTLSSLSDVSISGATAGQVLTYRNGTWRNETPQGGGGSAEELTNKTVTPSTIDGLSGSFTFQGDNLISSATDYVGMQIGSAYDKIQIAGQAGSLMIRQNDSGGTNSSGWTDWTMMLTASNYSSYITGYLPLTGGTLTGNLNINNANLSVTGNGSMNQLTVGSGSINSVITTVKYTSQSGYGFKIIPDTNRLADFYIFRSNYTSSSTRYSFLYTYFDDEGINTLQMTKSSSENNFNIGQGFASRSGHTNLWGYSINFRTKVGGSTSTTHMTITNTGNVGVGTEAPEYKLDVNGDVRADNFIGNFANKTVTASTLDGLAGSFTFEGNELTTSGYDEVGIQVGSSVDKFQIIGKSGTLLVRQNDNGGTSTSGWSGWTMLPTKVFTSNQLTKTDQWYRVANLTTYGLSYVVSIRDNFYHREPTPATFIINTSYTNATITQIGRASTTPTDITKFRVVKYGNGTFHVEVYTPKLSGSSSASMNTPEVNIFNLGRENTSDGIALVHDPNDDTKWLEVDKNIASGETLIEEATISTENYATSLKTPRSLWGQSFDGTGNVSGTIASSYFKIQDSSSNPYLQFIGGSTNWYLQYYNNAMYMGTGYTNSIMINSSGNVGIGTTSPAYKLDVNGDVQATNFRGNFVGNADSATKLKTARTIWGQSFDGTANVSGSITNATTITASSNVSVGGTLGVTGATTLSSTLSVSGTSTLTGHVGIGTSPHNTYVLRANGEVYVSTGLYSHGYVTALSDIRHKDIQGDVGLTVSDVANAPAVKFLWKDRRQEGLQVGSIAQYWQKVLPEAIVEAADGELTMSYGVIALLAAIANAREIVNLKREIAELKRKLRNHGILE